MLDSKFNFAMQVIYERINNLVKIKTYPKDIAQLLIRDCRLELRIPDTKKDMMIEFYRSLAEQAWYTMYMNFDYEEINK